MAKKKEKPEGTGLNERQELFCRYYAQNDSTFGNATTSYAAAYDYDLGDLTRKDMMENTIVGKEYRDDYNACSVGGSKLLRVAKVQARVTVLLNELLKDEIVDAELAKVIKQDGKLEPKVSAIREYNKLRGRIIEKSQITQVQKLDMDDIRVLIGVLPQERQDEFYATITTILAEAELRRGSVQNTDNRPQRSEEHPA